MKHRHSLFLVILMVVSMLTTSFAWASNGAAIQHELDHQAKVFPAELALHVDIHEQHQPAGDTPLDNTTHLYLHLAGHLHPFFTSPYLAVEATQATQPLLSFAVIFIPESVPDSLLRPPKTSNAI